MATTDRQFNDERILDALNKLSAFSAGNMGRVDDVNFRYPAPTQNGTGVVEVDISVVVNLSVEEADAILFNKP